MIAAYTLGSSLLASPVIPKVLAMSVEPPRRLLLPETLNGMYDAWLPA